MPRALHRLPSSLSCVSWLQTQQTQLLSSKNTVPQTPLASHNPLLLAACQRPPPHVTALSCLKMLQQPPGSLGSPPRGSHASCLAKQWETAETSIGLDFSSTWPGASTPPVRSEDDDRKKQRSSASYGGTRRREKAALPTSGTGVIGERFME